VDPLACAIEVAREAGALLLHRIGEPLDVQQKSSRGDLVTAADRASEALIVQRLRRDFPADAILGEEGGSYSGTSGNRWILDPLDGTTNYAHGYPLYCVSIGYERAGEVVCGAIYAPAIDELFAGERGGGTTLNGKHVKVSGVQRVADAMVCTGFKPAFYDRNGALFAVMSQSAQAVRRDGSAALDLAFTACGRFDAFWERDLSPWDVACGALLVREAGGRTSTIDGAPFTLEGGSTLASNGFVHAEMIETLGRA
jgi:myo-inositol-1(or 4)-monophosphatase